MTWQFCSCPARNSRTDDPWSPSATRKGSEAQASGLDCQDAGDRGQGCQSPRCSAAQHHNSAAGLQSSRQTGREDRVPGGRNGDGALQLLGQARKDWPLPGASVGTYLPPRGRPQAGFSLAVQNPRSHAAGRRQARLPSPQMGNWRLVDPGRARSWLQPSRHPALPCRPT